MACSYGTNFLSVTAAELFSSGVGDSEKIVADLFHRARLASPCILFVDELEAVVGSRQAKVKAANENILSTFLTEMDGVGVAMEIASSLPNSGKDDFSPPQVVVVAATNRPDLIDSALLRPGRLDRIVAVPPPNESERAEILAKVTGKMKLEADVDLVEIARLTHLYSGADLVNLCKEAALLALAEDMDIRSVSMRHFLKSTAQSTPSLSQESLQLFQEYSRSS
jgi:transitional endoplasmic reticulum ATPase